MAIKFQNYYGCSRSWNLLLSRANTLKIKSSQRGFVKPGSSGFWNPEVPDFNSYITIWPVTYSFTPYSLSHILSDTSTIRERRFCGDSSIWPRISRGKGGTLVISIEVPDPLSGIDFKPFPPWATVQNHSFCPISLPRIDLFDSFGRTPTFRP